MRNGFLASAALALGVSAMVPSFARADQYRDERGNERYVERREENVNVAVEVRDLPRPVLDAVASEAHGRPIESAQFVRNEGHEYFRVRIDSRGGDQTMLIAPNGRVINPDEQASYGRDARRVERYR